jgi:hypothetical protein
MKTQRRQPESLSQMMADRKARMDESYKRIIISLSEIHGEDVSVYFENVRLRAALSESLSRREQRQGWLSRLKGSIIGWAKVNILVVATYYFLLPWIYNVVKRLGIDMKKTDKVFLTFAGNHLRAVSPVVSRAGDTALVLIGLIGQGVHRERPRTPFERLMLIIDGFITPSDFISYYLRQRKVRALGAALSGSIANDFGLGRRQALAALQGTVLFYYMNFFRYRRVGENLSKLFSHCKFYFGNDSCHRSRAIITEARKAGIKTVVIQHGVMASTKLYRPFADKIAVWGPVERLKLLDLGVEDSRISITGSPVHSSGAEPLKGMGVKGLTILFATNPAIPVEQRRWMLGEVAAASRRLGASLIVRPHPVEEADIYRRVDCAGSGYVVDKGSALETQMSLADVGIIINSTVGLDMVLKGLLLLQFKIDGLADDTRFDSFDYVKTVRSSAEIVDAIRSMVDEPRVDKKRSELINSYISQFGDEAADAIIAI